MSLDVKQGLGCDHGPLSRAGDSPVDPPGWASGEGGRLQPSAGSASLGLGVPAALMCARTTVLSSRTADRFGLV